MGTIQIHYIYTDVYDGPNLRTRLTDIGSMTVEFRVFAPPVDGNNLHTEVVGRRNGRNTTLIYEFVVVPAVANFLGRRKFLVLGEDR